MLSIFLSKLQLLDLNDLQFAISSDDHRLIDSLTKVDLCTELDSVPFGSLHVPSSIQTFQSEPLPSWKKSRVPLGVRACEV